MSTTYEILYRGRVEAVITSVSDEPYFARLLLSALRETPTDLGTTGVGYQLRQKEATA